MRCPYPCAGTIATGVETGKTAKLLDRVEDGFHATFRGDAGSRLKLPAANGAQVVNCLIDEADQPGHQRSSAAGPWWRQFVGGVPAIHPDSHCFERNDSPSRDRRLGIRDHVRLSGKMSRLFR